jgi:hypothetical protein
MRVAVAVTGPSATSSDVSLSMAEVILRREDVSQLPVLLVCFFMLSWTVWLLVNVAFACVERSTANSRRIHHENLISPTVRREVCDGTVDTVVTSRK